MLLVTLLRAGIAARHHERVRHRRRSGAGLRQAVSARGGGAYPSHVVARARSSRARPRLEMMAASPALRMTPSGEISQISNG